MAGSIYCGGLRLDDAGYPPLRLSGEDKANQERLEELREKAPFGKVRGKAITPTQYRVAMQRAAEDYGAIDFSWPFWIGLGLGTAGVVVLARKRRRRSP